MGSTPSNEELLVPPLTPPSSVDSTRTILAAWSSQEDFVPPVRPVATPPPSKPSMTKKGRSKNTEGDTGGSATSAPSTPGEDERHYRHEPQSSNLMQHIRLAEQTGRVPPAAIEAHAMDLAMKLFME